MLRESTKVTNCTRCVLLCIGRIWPPENRSSPSVFPETYSKSLYVFNTIVFAAGWSTVYAPFSALPPPSTPYNITFVPRTIPWSMMDTVTKGLGVEDMPRAIGTFQFCIAPCKTMLSSSPSPRTTFPCARRSPDTDRLVTRPLMS